MTRREAITIIENCYPANSEHPDIAKKGARLLAKARTNIPWRDEDDGTLERYAILCIKEEAKSR